MLNLRRLRITQRLALAFSAILLILAVSVAVGVWRLQALSTTTRALGSVESEKLRLALGWRALVEVNWVRTEAAVRDADTGKLPLWQEEMDRSSAAGTPDMQRMRELVQASGDGALVVAIDTARDAFRNARGALLKRKKAGEDVTAALDRDLKPLSLNFIAKLDDLVRFQQSQVARALADAEASTKTGQLMLVVGGLSALLLASLLAWALARSIVQPLKQATASAARIAEGDLTEQIQVAGHDEASALLAALKNMQQALSRLVADVRLNSESVATASAQIATGNNDLSARTERQASALQQTAATMEQLGGTVRNNAANAKQANQLAQGASKVADQGGQVVTQVVTTMNGINASGKRIADIIGVIDGIAFQTNILALNAAVEAARAGEQGRGFAVVATEVRSLAQRSADAAKQIKTLITGSVEQVEQGSRLVDQAGKTMTEIVHAIKRVSEIVGEISSSSAEQSNGVGQVGQAVSQMDQATQQNAALVEESAAAAESLRQQAQELVQTVATFKLAAQASPA
jgi:methyl-accepting chemotaxis protein